jgi:hypothetical protein
VSGSAVLAAYARTGGRPPADDERLEVFEDGTWRLWRTLGGDRVGAFGGRLSPGRRRRLEAAVSAARAGAGTVPPARPRPDGAHDAFTTRHGRLDVSAGAPVSGPWSGLVRLLRRWTEALTDVPVAALALEAAPGGGPPQVVHLGSDGLALWPATLHVDLYARDADGIIRDRASGGADPEDRSPRGEAVTVGPGWSMRLPVERLPVVPEGGALETWVLLDIESHGGPVRARLTFRAPDPG